MSLSNGYEELLDTMQCPTGLDSGLNSLATLPTTTSSSNERLPLELQVEIMKLYMRDWACRVPSREKGYHEATNRCRLQLRQYIDNSFPGETTSYVAWFCIPSTLVRREAYSGIDQTEHATYFAQKVQATRLYSTILSESNLVLHENHHHILRQEFFRNLIVCLSVPYHLHQILSKEPSPVHVDVPENVSEAFWKQLDHFGVKKNEFRDARLKWRHPFEPVPVSPWNKIPFPREDLSNIRHLSIQIGGPNGLSEGCNMVNDLYKCLRDPHYRAILQNLASIEIDGTLGVGYHPSGKGQGRGVTKKDLDMLLVDITANLILIRKKLSNIKIYLRQGDDATESSSAISSHCKCLWWPDLSGEAIDKFCKGEKFKKSGPRSNGERGLIHPDHAFPEERPQHDMSHLQWMIRVTECWDSIHDEFEKMENGSQDPLTQNEDGYWEKKLKVTIKSSNPQRFVVSPEPESLKLSYRGLEKLIKWIRCQIQLQGTWGDIEPIPTVQDLQG